MAAAKVNNDDVPRDGGGEAGRRGVGVFAGGLRGRRLRIAVCYALWGAAGLISTTVHHSQLEANADHVMLYFVVLVLGVLLLLLAVAAADTGLPGLERAADRLDGRLRAMLGLD